MSEAGLLVKVADGMEDDGYEPWHACRPEDWCGHVDHVSLSLINHNLPHVYANPNQETTDVGFVLKSDIGFYCAMIQDGGTVMEPAGGCDNRCECNSGFGCAGDWCVYHSHQLFDFVRDTTEWNADDYNEVVIMKTDWEAALPHSIEAVFCIRTATCDQARDVHARFLSTYGLTAQEVPLVHYDRATGFTAV